MAAYKVIQWGTGGVGVWALRQVLDAHDLELVGLKCATDAKAGVDAGIIAGRDPVGIAATKNADELVKSLTRQYNRARQSQITRELADIVGAAAAI